MKSSRLLHRSSRLLFQRPILRTPTRHTISIPSTLQRQPQPTQHHSQRHLFSTTSSRSVSLTPESADPSPPSPDPQGASPHNKSPAQLTDSQYHDLADTYIENLLFILEQKADAPGSEYDVEYSAGVLELKCPQGVYIINKQPPNKQIWLSSPVSGPKRYDWVTASEGQNVKEGTEQVVGDDGQPGGGKWLYLRDGSTFTELLKSEIGVEVKMEEEEIRRGAEGA